MYFLFKKLNKALAAILVWLILLLNFYHFPSPPAAHAANGYTVIILSSSGTWTVPSDWNPNNNTIEGIGAGGYGGGGIPAKTGGGGGGGSYAIITNFDPAGRTQIDYTIGVSSLISGESDTVFGDNELFAEGGGIGQNSTSQVNGVGGSGGLAADNTPSVGAHSGGDGAGYPGGGGGGAAGPSSDGSSATDGTGGSGGSSSGGAGGAASMSGGDGTTWQDTSSGEVAGPGGGAGAGGMAGGNYGGGGGGTTGARNPGTDGVIVITYLPLSTGTSGIQTSNQTSNFTSPGCGDLPPAGSPSLFQITTTNKSAKLFFTPVKNTVTGYKIVYGFKDGIPRFGTSINYGKSPGAISTTIGGLKPKTFYFFKVLPVNGCASGNYSNSLQAKTTRSKTSKAIFHLKK